MTQQPGAPSDTGEIIIRDAANTDNRCWCVLIRLKGKPDDFYKTLLPFYETFEQAEATAKGAGNLI